MCILNQHCVEKTWPNHSSPVQFLVENGSAYLALTSDLVSLRSVESVCSRLVRIVGNGSATCVWKCGYKFYLYLPCLVCFVNLVNEPLYFSLLFRPEIVLGFIRWLLCGFRIWKKTLLLRTTYSRKGSTRGLDYWKKL